MLYLFRCDTVPDMGSVPAIKTTEYPLSPYGTGPICQFRFVQIPGRGVIADITAFERDPFLAAGHSDPLKDSSAAVVFDFYPDMRLDPICAVFNSAGQGGIYSKTGQLLTPLRTDTYAGVDEQGWYWGIRFCITEEYLTAKYGCCNFAPGDHLRGNAYKFFSGDNGHFGAIAPMKDTDIFSEDNLTDFSVRAY